MKRQAITLLQIACRENLLLAAYKAAHGKQQRPAVAQFFARLDDNLNLLAKSILDGCAPQGLSHSFAILDPKPRIITAACFADRVLHHAIMNIAAVRFETMLVPSTFACRPNKGVHCAVVAVQQGLQRYAWVAQVDVAGYFPSIEHGTLKNLLAQRFKGPEFLALLGRIIDCGNFVTDPLEAPDFKASSGNSLVDEERNCRGLPIGALTSQYFANAYLDGADRFLLNHPQVCAHVRYMDDMLWCCNTREAAVETVGALAAFLSQTLGLRLKPNFHIGRSTAGVRYCGFRVRQGVVLASARKLTRYRRHTQKIAVAQECGYASSDVQRASDCAHAALARTQTQRFRQTLWQARQGKIQQQCEAIANA
jgi:RNA-directed DNA polymerase